MWMRSGFCWLRVVLVAVALDLDSFAGMLVVSIGRQWYEVLDGVGPSPAERGVQLSKP